jgi:phosphoribosylformylglycinamidine synthase
VGLIADSRYVATLALKPQDEVIILIGPEDGHLGQSLYQEYATGQFEGAPPPVDLAAERKSGDFVRRLVETGMSATVHDVSDGGLLVALAEMAIAGRRGFRYAPAPALPSHAAAFGEDQGRYLVAVSEVNAENVIRQAKSAGVPARVAAYIQGDEIVISGEDKLSLSILRKVHEEWLPKYMGTVA